MDILQFRESVREILDKEGATFPDWSAKQRAITTIAERAIDYAGDFADGCRGKSVSAYKEASGR